MTLMREDVRKMIMIHQLAVQIPWESMWSLVMKQSLVMHLRFSNFGCPGYGSITKPHLLNDVVHESYLLSPDPTIMAFALKPENRDPEDRLACEHLVFKMFVPKHFLHNEEQEEEKARLIESFGKSIMTSGLSRGSSSPDTQGSQLKILIALSMSGTRTTQALTLRYLAS